MGLFQPERTVHSNINNTLKELSTSYQWGKRISGRSTKDGLTILDFNRDGIDQLDIVHEAGAGG